MIAVGFSANGGSVRRATIEVAGQPFTVDQFPTTDIVVDFGAPYGVWVLSGAGAWTSLHNLSPLAMVKGDLDGNGQIYGRSMAI